MHIKKTAKGKAASSKKKNILDDTEEEQSTSLAETPIWLTVTTKRHISDSKALKPGKIVLPHPLQTDSESTICLIVPEPQRAYKNLVASDEFPEELRKRITRVIDLKHLGAKFKQYEAQRKLFAEHDIFLGDDRVINRLPKLLGKTFYKTTAKRPIPVIFQKPKLRVDGKRGKRVKNQDEVNVRPTTEVAAEIVKSSGAALVHLSPSTNTAVKVGFASMTAEELAANIEKVAVTMATKYVPKKKNGVKSMFLKGNETVALPIWQTDELWLDAESDLVVEGSERAEAIAAKAAAVKGELPNVGKKRKSLDAPEKEEEKPKAKKAKKEKKEPLPEPNDDKLKKEISERKTRLRNQKKAAKAAVDE